MEYCKASTTVRSVWSHNLISEFALIAAFLNQGIFRHAAIDTEFPGVIYNPPLPISELTPEERYAYMKANIDNLHIIQLGLTLTDAHGNLPDLGEGGIIWEFNFRDFNTVDHPHVLNSIDLLETHGLDLDALREDGIDSNVFGKLIVISGLVHGPEPMEWVAFSGAYDFGYLVKVLSGGMFLPETLVGFLVKLEGYLGENVYDMKFLCGAFCGIRGGLDRVARQLRVRRAVGSAHQAGSDSLLLAHAFLKVKEMRLVRYLYGGLDHDYDDDDRIDEDGKVCRGIICGLQVAF